MQTETTWLTLIERVKLGETTVADADIVAQVQQAIADLRAAYPGYEYFSCIGRLLALYQQLSGEADA